MPQGLPPTFTCLGIGKQMVVFFSCYHRSRQIDPIVKERGSVGHFRRLESQRCQGYAVSSSFHRSSQSKMLDSQ